MITNKSPSTFSLGGGDDDIPLRILIVTDGGASVDLCQLVHDLALK